MTAWFWAHWEFIKGSLCTVGGVMLLALPSIIVGASEYPRMQNWLKVLLDILTKLSKLQPKDSPGTFKPLFRRATPPLPPAEPYCDTEAPTEPGRKKIPDVVPFLLLGAALALSACCHGAACKRIQSAIVDCTTESLLSAAEKIYPDVVSALLGPHGGRSAQEIDSQWRLVELEQVAGEGVMCAVGRLLRDLTAGGGRALPPNAAYAVDEAQTYLASKKPKTVKLVGQ